MTMRASTPDDLGRAVELLRADGEHLVGRPSGYREVCRFYEMAIELDGQFHRRGVTRISLGVDSESPTGATKLYESVGMQVELEQVVFERALA